MMKKWMQKRLSKIHAGAVVGGMSLVPMIASAQTAQPDTSDATDYLAAGVATVGLVFGSKFIIAGVVYLSRVVKAAIGR